MCSSVEQQKRLITALHDPSVFPHTSNDWQLIETHISWVILCGSFAYKIKKSLDLGFLDCRTLASRKFYCEEELRLNSRLAPDLYLEVVAITGSAADPQLGGTGPVFEYAVKMQRFPPAELLSELVDDGKLLAEHIDQLVAQISDFHLTIPAATADMPFGDLQSVHGPALENFDQLRERVSNPRYLEWIERLQVWTEAEYERLGGILELRKKLGFIRECHGDMHLGNMVMIADAPLIFDGIDFNPDLYWIDVMSEVAFLFMDLEHHGRKDYAFRFLNGYLERTGDYGGLQVFRYYLVYRAIVRAKVACIRADQQSNSDAQAASIAELEQHLALALDNSRPQRPVLLLTHGLSGSGKSTLSARLLESMGAVRIRSDRERQRVLGRGLLDGKAAALDSGVYSRRATAQTYATLEVLAENVLEAGYSVIVDATFLQREQREPFKALATRLGLPFRILSFRAETAVLKQRITARQSDGTDISEADLSVLQHQLDHYTELAADEQRDTVIIDTQLSCSGQEMLAQVTQSLDRTADALRHA